jgi:hypothetical protein
MKNAGEYVNVILLFISCRFPTKFVRIFTHHFRATSFPYLLLLNTVTLTLFDGDKLRHENFKVF